MMMLLPTSKKDNAHRWHGIGVVAQRFVYEYLMVIRQNNDDDTLMNRQLSLTFYDV
jgi:hypothetical protein